MDKLKSYINTHRDAFEDDLLPEGHFERFEQKLPAGRRRPISFYTLVAMAAAASIALLLLWQLPITTVVPTEETPVQAETDSELQEMDELQFYYQMQVNDIMARMEKLYKQEQTTGTTGLMEASKQILADNLQFEEHILPTLSPSDDALFAITQHYSVSVNSLNLVLQQMEQVINEE